MIGNSSSAAHNYSEEKPWVQGWDHLESLHIVQWLGLNERGEIGWMATLLPSTCLFKIFTQTGSWVSSNTTIPPHPIGQTIFLFTHDRSCFSMFCLITISSHLS